MKAIPIFAMLVVTVATAQSPRIEAPVRSIVDQQLIQAVNRLSDKIDSLYFQPGPLNTRGMVESNGAPAPAAASTCDPYQFERSYQWQGSTQSYPQFPILDTNRNGSEIRHRLRVLRINGQPTIVMDPEPSSFLLRLLRLH